MLLCAIPITEHFHNFIIDLKSVPQFCHQNIAIYLPPLSFCCQLSDADKLTFVQLKAIISSTTGKSPQTRHAMVFADTLEVIRTFIVRNNKDDKIRSLVCGIYWIPGGIPINIHQLRPLVPKCKSSINGSF
jgi:hypothetical protein